MTAVLHVYFKPDILNKGPAFDTTIFFAVLLWSNAWTMGPWIKAFSGFPISRYPPSKQKKCFHHFSTVGNTRHGVQGFKTGIHEFKTRD